MPDYTFIDSAPALEASVATWLAAEAVAIDTEFVWERTFFPDLGLIQLATGPDACWLIDTVAIQDLSALAPLIESRDVVKILHDAVQDLSILRRATGASPRNVFDTRVAGGFVGQLSTLSLQALTERVLDRHLPKGESRSNWLRRPLSQAQLDYAVEDVAYLPALRKALLALTTHENVKRWLQDELAALDEPSQYDERSPTAAYLRIRGAGRLGADQLAALRELAAWREIEARRQNRPRGHILHDRTLLPIAQAMPRSINALQSLDELSPRTLKRIGDAVITAIQTAAAMPEAEHPPRFPAPGAQIRKQLKTEGTQLLEYIRSRCTSLGVDPALVSSRRDAESWLRQHLEGEDASDHPFATTWRRELIARYPMPSA